jgi:hypothetical protein
VTELWCHADPTSVLSSKSLWESSWSFVYPFNVFCCDSLPVLQRFAKIYRMYCSSNYLFGKDSKKIRITRRKKLELADSLPSDDCGIVACLHGRCPVMAVSLAPLFRLSGVMSQYHITENRCSEGTVRYRQSSSRPQLRQRVPSRTHQCCSPLESDFVRHTYYSIFMSTCEGLTIEVSYKFCIRYICGI